MRALDIIAKSWGKIIIATMMLVIKMVRWVRVSGRITLSRREQRKTLSKPVTISFLMNMIWFTQQGQNMRWHRGRLNVH